MWFRRPLAAAALAVACYAGGSWCDSTGVSGPTFKEAPALALQLEAVNRAVAPAPLRALSGLTVPINMAGIDANNMTPSELGKTLEWNVIHGEEIFTPRAGAPANTIRVLLYVTDSTFRPE